LNDEVDGEDDEDFFRENNKIKTNRSRVDYGKVRNLNENLQNRQTEENLQLLGSGSNENNNNDNNENFLDASSFELNKSSAENLNSSISKSKINSIKKERKHLK